MATYLDLRNRVITETNRDDLADTLAAQLKLHVSQAIEFYANRRFWFTEGIEAGVCVVGNEYASKPAGMRTIDRVTVAVGAVQYKLRASPLTYIDELAIITSIGQPVRYAELGDQIRLWPRPGIAYPLNFIGVVDQPALVADSDTNAWTTHGYDLITARTKFTLYRGQFKDQASAASAKDEETEVLFRLQRETNNRLGSGMTPHG